VRQPLHLKLNVLVKDIGPHENFGKYMVDLASVWYKWAEKDLESSMLKFLISFGGVWAECIRRASCAGELQVCG
jgi:hypothetical protein